MASPISRCLLFMTTIPHGYRISTDILNIALQSVKDGRQVSDIKHNPWSAACPCLRGLLDWIFCKYHGIDDEIVRILDDNSYEILSAFAFADTSKKQNIFYIDITERLANTEQGIAPDVTRFRITTQGDRIFVDQLFSNPRIPPREFGESDISFKQLQTECLRAYDGLPSPPENPSEPSAYDLNTVKISMLKIDVILARDLIRAGRNRNEVIAQYALTERSNNRNGYVDLSQFDVELDPTGIRGVGLVSENGLPNGSAVVQTGPSAPASIRNSFASAYPPPPPLPSPSQPVVMTSAAQSSQSPSVMPLSVAISSTQSLQGPTESDEQSTPLSSVGIPKQVEREQYKINVPSFAGKARILQLNYEKNREGRGIPTSKFTMQREFFMQIYTTYRPNDVNPKFDKESAEYFVRQFPCHRNLQIELRDFLVHGATALKCPLITYITQY